MDWYQGATLMHTLENVQISSDHNHVDARFPIQYVIRPQSHDHPDYRGYAGRVAGGIFKPGDEVIALPSGLTTKITTIDIAGKQLDEAYAPMSVTINLADDVDISRGDMIAKVDNQPETSQDIDLMVCWMTPKKLVLNGKYGLRHTSRDARCVIKEVKYKVNINTLHRDEEETSIGMNDIGRIKVRTTVPLFYDRYTRNRITGSVIIVDEFTNETVGAGMIL